MGAGHDGKYFSKLAELAGELGIYLALGLHEDSGREHYKTAALIGPDGSLVGRNHKHRLCHEVDRHTPGTDFPTFETPYGNLGMMICADRGRHFVWKGLCNSGADFLFCLSGGSFGPLKNEGGVALLSGIHKKHAIFMHPAEFLVTSPEGTTLDLALFGDPTQLYPSRLVAEEDVDGASDLKKICYCGLPIGTPGNDAE